MTTAKFAAPGSLGTFANKIGWIDYDAGFKLMPGATPIHVINSLPDGFTVEFDINCVSQGTVPNPFHAQVPPVLVGAPFGTTGYTGIAGNVVLYSAPKSGGIQQDIFIKNIVVKNSTGNATTTYQIIAADAEMTSLLATIPQSAEIWSVTTDGSPWSLIDNLPSSAVGTATDPQISGLGTATVTETAVGKIGDLISGPVYSTNAPVNLIASATSSAQEGFAFGIIITAREQAITDMIESIALEETALSHILNAEGEKLQKAIAMKEVTASELLCINKSVEEMVKSIATLEIVLQSKLDMFTCDICAACTNG